jgi:hypothetical protein
MLKVMQDLMKKQKEKIPEKSRNQLSFAIYNKEKNKIECASADKDLVSQNVLLCSCQSTIAKIA